MQDAKQKEEEEMDNYTEISNQAFGDFLTENPQTAISALGKHRLVFYFVTKKNVIKTYHKF